MKFLLHLLLLGCLTLLPASAADLTRFQAGKITQVAASILEQAHFKQMALDDASSGQFLTNYLNALDYNRMIFNQTDVDDFVKRYATNLDNLSRDGDVTPAYEIFERYLKRLGEREKLVTELLEKNYDFNKDEKFLAARNKELWPKNEDEMTTLWTARIKSELLQDRLAKTKLAEDAKAKAEKVEGDKKEAAAPKPYDPAEAKKLIAKRYQRLLKSMNEFDTEEILQVYLTALANTYDPHSDYMSPNEADNFDIHIKASLTGIGALLRSEDGYTKIVSLVPGGPAALSKQLKPNDKIIAVAQGSDEPVDTVEEKLSKVVNMIRGKRGTEVRLTVIPASSVDGSETKVITLVRDEIKLADQLAKAKLIEETTPSGGTLRWGVIQLPQFNENCARDVEKLVDRLQKEKIDGLILDMRRNGGGILEEAVKMTGLFIKTGPVVQVKNSAQQLDVMEDENTKVSYDGPLVVLVDHLSASASEIVAAALQDYGRAVVVGDQTTHGKGTVQSLLPLTQFMRQGIVSNAGKLKFTVSKFYRIAGNTTQRNGVTPDIVLPSLLDYMELGEASLPNSLAPDSINPATYTKYDRSTLHLAELTKRSDLRVNQNSDFGYVKEDIDRLKKQREDRSISLNESQRRQETEDNKVRLEARKTEREKRDSSHLKVSELSLEAANKDQPFVPLKNLAATSTDNPAPINLENPDEAAEETPEVTTDAHLEETLRILRDLAELQKKAPTGSVANTRADASK